jgi:hypothetical protein
MTLNGIPKIGKRRFCLKKAVLDVSERLFGILY